MANANSNIVQIKERTNCIKISAILIDVCTGVVQDLLEDVIKNPVKYKLFYQVTHSNFADYLEKNQHIFENNQKDFYQSQLKKLFPKEQKNSPATSPKSFDLTLCIKLLRRLLVWSWRGVSYATLPDDNDLDVSADIQRLSLIRNENYGHLDSYSLPSNELNNLKDMKKQGKTVYSKFSILAKLEDILARLSKKIKSDPKYLSDINKKIEDILQTEFSDQKISHYRDKIIDLMAGDRRTVELICDFVSKKMDKKNNQLVLLLDSIKKQENNNANSMNKILTDLLKLMKKNDLSLRDEICRMQSTIEKGFEAINQTLDSASQDIKAIKTEQKDIKDIMTRQIIESMFDQDVFKDIRIPDLKEYFEEEYRDLYFKILILDAKSCDYTKIDKQRLAKSLGVSKWNIIIDLDNYAESENGDDGLMVKILQHSSMANYSKITFSQLDRMSNSDKYCIFNGTRLCYIYGEPSQERNYYNFRIKLRKFITKFPVDKLDKTVLCASILLRKSYSKQDLENIEDFYGDIIDGFHDIEMQSDKIDSLFIMPSDLKNLKDKMPYNRRFNYEISKGKKLLLLQPPSEQIVTALLSTQNDSERLEEYKMPGSEGEYTLSHGFVKKYSDFFEIYHKNIGEIEPSKIEKGAKQEKYFNELRKSFCVLGKEITPEMIHIHDVHRDNMFVESNMIKKEIDFITEKSKIQNDFRKYIRKITHFPSCGGTTIGRVILYRLRTQLPCIRLIYCDSDDVFLEGIREISRQSESTLVILIDDEAKNVNSPFDFEQVDILSDRLRATETMRRHIIIFVNRTNDIKKSNLPKLEKTDLDKFSDLYKKCLPDSVGKLGKNKVYLNLMNIRLLILGKNMTDEKLEDLMNEYFVNLNQNDYKLIFIMHFIDKFTNGRYLSHEIVEQILQKKNVVKEFTTFLTEPISKEYEHIYFLLKYKKGFKIIHADLGECFVKHIAQDKKKDKFQLFFEYFLTLFHLFKNQSKSYIILIAELVLQLLVGHSKETDDFIDHLEDIIEEFWPKHENFDLRKLSEAIKRVFEQRTKLAYFSIKDNQGKKRAPDLYEKLKEKLCYYLDLHPSENCLHSMAIAIQKAGDEYFTVEKVTQKEKKWIYHTEFVFESYQANQSDLNSFVVNLIDHLDQIENHNLVQETSLVKASYARFLFFIIQDEIGGIKWIKSALEMTNEKSIRKEYPKLPEEIKTTVLLTSYADLFRNKIKNTFKILKDTGKSGFSKLKDDCEESLFAYKKAYAVNENNMLAYAGECKLRKNVITYFLELECTKKEGDTLKDKYRIYTQKIKNGEVPEIVKESDEEIIIKLDQMDQINSKINTFVGFSSFYEQCYKIVGQTNTVSIDDELGSLMNEKLERPINIYWNLKIEFEKKECNENKYFDWTCTTLYQLKCIFTRCSLQIEKGIHFSSGYRQLILSLIHGKIKGINIDKDLEFAIEKCGKWKTKFEKEPDAFYYLGIFHLIKGIENMADKEACSFNLRSAKENFETCQSLYNAMKDPPPAGIFRMPEFLIGKKKGVARLVPFSNDPRDELESFKEDLKSRGDSHYYFLLKGIIDLKCLKRNAHRQDDVVRKTDISRHDQYGFNISISRAQLMMFKYVNLSQNSKKQFSN